MYLVCTKALRALGETSCEEPVVVRTKLGVVSAHRCLLSPVPVAVPVPVPDLPLGEPED